MLVVFVNMYTVYNRDMAVYYPGTDAFFRFGMGVFVADEFIKRGYPVSFENWRMDMRIGEIMEKTVDGIQCRIFPSKKIKFLGEYSSQMAEAFKQYSGRKDVVVHFMSIHSRTYHYYAHLVRKNRAIATHLGGSNPYWSYKNESDKKALVNYLLEKWFFLKPYDHIITMSRTEAEYFKMLKKICTLMPIFGIPMVETLEIRDRVQSRQKLGLPVDKKILLQVGRATSERGFDWIIEMLDKMKDSEEFFWVFVGVHKEDEYYPLLMERGVFIKDYTLRPELVDYYNAADVLYYLPNGVMDLNFAGTSYVPLEAMACGTPVVATTFHHFPGDEVFEVSRIPKCKEDVIPMIEELLAANVSRERCREIVVKYFSWDSVLHKLWEIYTAPPKN
ncbi:Glycosyl transferases group 1 [anaerobic digester metagenome]